MRAPRAVADECAAILNSPPGLMPGAKAALKRAYLIHLPRDPELAEQIGMASGVEAVSAEVHSDPQLAWLRLNTAQNPAGIAVVRSVIDSRRAGVIRPLLEDELKQLFPIHLAEIEDLPASDELFAAGMEWAQNPGPGVLPMLVRRRHQSGPSWTVSRQLSEDRASWKIPDALWPALFTMLDAQECLHVARAAEAHGKLLHATKAAAKAATSPEQATLANLLLGRLHQKLGNVPAAKRALVAAVDIGPSDEACVAAHLLGRIFHDEEDFEHAIEYWTLATQWPGGTPALMSWFELGRLHAMLGNRKQAVDALSRDFSDDLLPDLSLRAETLLAFAQGSIDDLQRLLEAWEGMEGGSGDDVAASALREYVQEARHGSEPAQRSPLHDHTDVDVVLADVRRLCGLGNRREALEEFHGRAASADSALRAAALYEAGSTAEDLGLLDEAREAFEASVLCAQPGYSGLAANSLGGLLLQAGDTSQAIRAWTAALEFGDPETRAKASFNIGIARHEAGDYRAAISSFENALGLAAPRLKAKIAMMLAATHETKVAIDTKHADWTPGGHCALGLLYASQDKTAMGKRHLGVANDSGHAEFHPEAPIGWACFACGMARMGRKASSRTR